MIGSNRARLALIPVGLYCMSVGSVFELTLNWSTAQAQTLPDPKPFVVLDGTLYAEKPDLSAFGIQPITIVYAGKFGLNWHKQSDHLPDKESVQRVAREAQGKSKRVVIDIEHWPLRGSSEVVKDSLQKYMIVLEWFKKSAPDFSVGYYGIPPLRDYWRAIKEHTTLDYISWVNENDAIAPLTRAVDDFYPSLYTFYPDQDGWKRYAIAQIEEARRVGNGKSVYVFLWPQYHDSNRLLGGRYLAEDFWQLELETARQFADGIVIWGGWDLKSNRPAKWDDNARWWKVTKDFMKTGIAPDQPSTRHVK